MSFALHPKAKYWSKDNIDKDGNFISPESIPKSSKTLYKFDCIECKHTFEGKPRNITHNTKGTWCPYCPKSGRKQLCKDEKCNICFEKTFASHPQSKYWSNKNKVNPREVPIGRSQVKYWFDCPECNNDFQMSPCHISVNNKWCPNCKNKTELKLHKALKEVYPNVETQFYAQWCKNYRNLPLPFDFLLEEYKIIIELDGDQHFIQVGKWLSPEEQQIRDLYKMKCANKNGYSIIRISQNDVFNDRIEWLDIIKESIHEIINKKEVHNYFISYKEDKYDNYIKNIL